MITYILLAVIYILMVVFSIYYDNNILLGLSGLAYLYPLSNENNTIITVMSVIMMLFHFLFAFYNNSNKDSLD